MKKRFLGLPVPIIAVGLAVLLIGGGVLAALVMQRDIESTVQIVGAGAEVYQDEACTIPLTTLDFGAIEAGGTTASIPFWVKNESDGGYDIYLALSQTGLDSLLALFEDSNGAVPEDPAVLQLGEAGWVETETTTTTRGGDLTPAGTNIQITSSAGFPTDGGMVKIDDEIMSYNAIKIAGAYWSLDGLVRGLEGTTAATHASGSVVTLLELANPTLAPGEVLPVVVYLEADPTITRADYPFTLTVYAQDIAF